MRGNSLVASFLLLAGLHVVFQVTTLERIKETLIRDPLAKATQVSMQGHLRQVLNALRPADWLLAGLMVLLVLWLIWREVRGRRISRELSDILQSGRRTAILLGAMASAACVFYLAPGEFALGDGPTHIAGVWGAAESLGKGQWPNWSFFHNAGFPLLQFYGWLFFVVVGAVGRLTGSLEWAAKIFLFLLHVGSAYPIYAWIRSIGWTRHAALIGGLAYVLSFQHTHTVIWTGALPVAMIYPLFACLLLATEKVLQGASRRWALLAAAATAGMVLSHHGYAVFAIELAALYAGIRWLLPGAARPGLARVGTVAISLAAGMLVCLGFLLPLWLEGPWVYHPTELPLLIPGLPTVAMLKSALVWRNLWSGWTVAYLGLSVVAFALAGSVRALRRSADPPAHLIARAIALTALVALLCAARSGRVMNLALPFLAALAGGVVLWLRPAALARGTMLLLGLLLLDLGPTTIQSPFRTDAQFLRSGYARAASRISPHRALAAYSSGSEREFYDWSPPWSLGLIQPTGYFPQGVPHSLNSIMAMVDAMNAPGDSLTSIQLDLLYLWDVSAILTCTRGRFVDPGVKGFPTEGTDPPFARIHPASPLLFAKTLAVAVDDSLEILRFTELLQHRDRHDPLRRTYRHRTSRWVEAMGIRRDEGSARAIFLANGEEQKLPAPGWAVDGLTLARATATTPLATGAEDATRGQEAEPDPAGSAIEVVSYAQDLRNVSITYAAKQAGYLRLAFSYYPALRLSVDGKPVMPLEALCGAMIIPTNSGRHTIELHPRQTQARLWSTIAGLASGGWLIAWMLRRQDT